MNNSESIFHYDNSLVPTYALLSKKNYDEWLEWMWKESFRRSYFVHLSIMSSEYLKNIKEEEYKKFKKVLEIYNG